MKETQNTVWKRPLDQTRLPYWVFAVYGFIGLFLYFLPFLYTMNNHQPTFVSGFSMFAFLEDTYPSLHNGVNMYLIGYVSYGLLLVLGLFGLFSKERFFRLILALSAVILLAQCGCEIAGIILLSQCESMHLFLEFGSYLSVILSGVVLLFLIVYLILKRKKLPRVD